MGKELFEKYLNGKLNESEFGDFLTWVKSESSTIKSRETIRTVWQNYNPSSETGDTQKYDRILDKVHHQINISNSAPKAQGKEYSQKSKVLSIVTKAAAILLLPILALYIYTSQIKPVSSEYESNLVSVESPAGSRVQLKLADGTKVILNGNSTLTYPQKFKDTIREVNLEGEAFFKVAHNSEVPFIVETDRMSIKATGTAFNVNAYSGEKMVETALAEGKVILYRKNGKKLKELFPGDCLKYNVFDNKYALTQDDIIKHIGWKDGILVFKNDSIENVVKRIERQYNVEILYADARIKELTYTGTFDNVSLNQLLDYLSLATPITYKYLPNNESESVSHQRIEIGMKRL